MQSVHTCVSARGFCVCTLVLVLFVCLSMCITCVCVTPVSVCARVHTWTCAGRRAPVNVYPCMGGLREVSSVWCAYTGVCPSVALW